ncbi:MAG: glycoside hydrolase family 3 N-terminal domain-containing protein [Solirubrobacterales bacterium]
MRPGKPGTILLALCALAAAMPLVAGARAGRTTVNAALRPPQPLAAADLTRRQLAGQRIVCGFDGSSAPASLLRVIAAGELAGVILFDDNIGSKAAVQRLTGAIQATDRPVGLRQPVLISIDQEGGQVKRLPGPPKMSAAEMGRRGAATARSQGAATGASLASYGVNVDLAPVLDVARPGGFIAEQQRSFGSKPGRVGAAGAAFAEGLESGGIAATAKHFPGLGSTSANTDLRPATIPLSAKTLRRVDIAPYESFVAAGGDLVMVGSARYPALGTGKLPASQSKSVMNRELRGTLGFTGVTVTDSLETPSIRRSGSAAKVAVRTAGAGADLLLYVHCDAGMRAAKALRRGLADGKLKRGPFEAAVDRVLGLRASL